MEVLACYFQSIATYDFLLQWFPKFEPFEMKTLYKTYFIPWYGTNSSRQYSWNCNIRFLH